MSNTTEYKTEGQLKVANAEKIVKFISDDFGIDTLPSNIASDKKELVDVYKQLVLNGGDSTFIFDINDKSIEEAPMKKPSKETKGQIRKRLRKELFVQFNVTIHDINPTESVDKDDDTRVRFVTWGNDMVGHFTTRVVFDKPTFIHEGCLRNLRQSTFRKTYTKSGSNELHYGPITDRFQITYNDVDEKFIEDLKKKQQLVANAGM